MTDPGVLPTLAVVGAGYIGRRHATAIDTSGAARVGMIADPSPHARDLADDAGAAWFPDFGTLLTAERPDGVIIATPTQTHMTVAMACIDAGIPVLVEKPLTASAEEAHRLTAAATAADVPVLVGHHRRHNPLIAAAKGAIDDGRIGSIVTVNAMMWVAKPDDYFSPEWRRQPGAGPILTNLIHDIDLMRHLCGDVTEVRAFTSRATRRHAVEDTATAILRFANGALGTLSVSDAVAAPWSWELTAAENADYDVTGQSCYQIGGTTGSLELPSLRLWQHRDDGGWHREMEPIPLGGDLPDGDPLVIQIQHFVDVIANRTEPLVTAHDGRCAIEIVDAIRSGCGSDAVGDFAVG